MATTETVWMLHHIYEVNDSEEVKFIGVFSSNEKANSVINELKELSGFKNYPLDCFQITVIKIDQYEWEEGFITWEEANG